MFYGGTARYYDDAYLVADNHLIAEELHARGINGSYEEKTGIMRRCVAEGADYKRAVLYAMPMLEREADAIMREINEEPVDSEIKFYPDSRPMFAITKEKFGRAADEERLYAEIYYRLLRSPQIRLQIPVKRVEPEITASDNVSLTGMRARHTTDCTYSNENRKHNIRLALSRINGATLLPGEEFSFNKAVGRRTESNGYKEAKIIMGGRYEDGYGGGVCQASTTLYNCAILSGLTITEAHAHSLECSYELPSFDAMVNGSFADLKFRNDGETPVFIRAYMRGGEVCAEIYGAELPYRIARKSEVVSRKEPPAAEMRVDENYEHFDRTAETGAQKVVSYSHGELKSRGWLLYYDKKGLLIDRKKFRENTYAEVRGVVMVAP